MNYYSRNSDYPVNVCNVVFMGDGHSLWLDKITGLPDRNYFKQLPSWELDMDLSAIKFKKWCVKNKWEF